MKDSREPENTQPGIWRRIRPRQPALAPSPAFESLEQLPPASPAGNQAGTRRSWLGKAALVPVAMTGAVGLVRLAYHVTTPKPASNEGIIVRSEVISLWMHPAFFDLAQHPSESEACRSQEGYRRYAEKRGLEKAWYAITAKGVQINGETMVLSTIRCPYEMIEPFYFEFPSILAVAAGKPPRDPVIDLTKCKIGVIPSRFLDADPRAVIDELRMLEQLPDQQTTP